MFDNKYDFVYNKPMSIWVTHVQPLLIELETVWFDETTVGNRTALLLSFAQDDRHRVVGVSEVICVTEQTMSKTTAKKLTS